MKKGSQKLHNSKIFKTYIGIFGVFIIICSIIFIFSFQYYKSLHGTIREESKNYLQEVSRRIVANIDRIIQNNYSMLYSSSAALETMNLGTISEMQTLLKRQKSYWECEKMLLVDNTGNAYDIENNNSLFFAFDDSVRVDMLNKNQIMTTSQLINNKEYFICAVPLSNVVIEGKKVISLAACYDPAMLDKVLSMNAFDEQAYSQIITKEGVGVTRSSSKYAIKSGYNIFSTLTNAEIGKGSSLDKMLEDVKNDIEGQIDFTLDGIGRYMVYTPIQSDDWYLLTFVPFKAVNEKSDMLLQITLFICGIIAFVFCGLLATLFFIFSNNKRKLEKLAYVDTVTGGNTIQKFYELARNILDTHSEEAYALVYTNIENFKILNAQMGKENCDAILRHFNIYFNSNLSTKECMGRVFADNFCILMEFTDEEELLKRFNSWAVGAEEYMHQNQTILGMPLTEFGVYVIDNINLPFPEMIDRAKLALKEFPHPINSKLRYAFYDDKVRRQMFREKQLSDMMEQALTNREFQMYLQPKYKLPEEVVGGAEALVRWKSATEGMIYPNEFIPLFEKNGFIVQLDLWMFEEVCKAIRLWSDQGLPLHKISVNCSRVHFKNPRFLAPYLKIADKYKINRSFVEIELTESVVFDDTEQLIKIIYEIREAGFGCSMDDFGSGYSSLNLIQSIPVDTIKIDKIFFQKDSGDKERLKAVVGSIIKLAHSLSMVIVAEGVELREQVDMLKEIGCDYIQGYVFAKPMDVESFEELAFLDVDRKRE